MTPSQPSPTSLSDELTAKLQSTLMMAANLGELTKSPKVMDELIAAITAAYAEAGYITPDEQIQALQEGKAHFRGQPVLTGMTWYERFEKELFKDTNPFPHTLVRTDMIVAAAKRASGLLPNNASDEGSAL